MQQIPTSTHSSTPAMARNRQTATTRRVLRVQINRNHHFNHEPYRTEMEKLTEKLFETYQPRHHLARSVVAESCTTSSSSDLSTKRIKTSPIDQNGLQVLTHLHLLEFLAPHEIMSLWRSCSVCWNALPSGRERKVAMLPSVLRYFRLSEESATHVNEHISGGWNAFLPVLVGVSERFAEFYHHLEPDPAHRALVGEQVCFFAESYGTQTMGRLAHHDRFLSPVLVEPDREKEPPPTLALLRERARRSQYELSTLNWGESHSYREEFRGAARPRCDDVVRRFHTLNCDWMRANASEAPHAHYRERVSRRLDPLIVLGEVRDTESGVQEYALGIGPNSEQFLVTRYASIDAYESRNPELFWDCVDSEDDEDWRHRGGAIGYLLGFALASRDDSYFEEWKPKPSLGVAIWALRRALEPLTDPDIDWIDLVEKVCRERSQGTDVDQSWSDLATQNFYIKALRDPFYGQADARKWGSKLLEGPSPAVVRWYDNGNDPGNDLNWSSFATTLEGLENCFLFLDSSWSFGSELANDVVRDLAEEIARNSDVRRIFPNVRIVHVRYCDWEPRHTVFRNWWTKQFATTKDADEYVATYSERPWNGLPNFLHVRRGKIMSVVSKPMYQVGRVLDKPYLRQSLRLLYLYSFLGDRSHQTTVDNADTDRSTGAFGNGAVEIPPSRDGGTYALSASERNNDETSHTVNGLATISALKPIATMHSEGKYFVGERGGDCGKGRSLLERIEKFNN